MKLIEGYVYHIKDEYFDIAKDPKLMQNKENGTYRPTYYGLPDKNTGLLWVVPMSTRIEKYQRHYDKQISKYGKSLTIVLGDYDGKSSAFLLQNMFPITEYYISHIHTKKGNPVPVNHNLQTIIRSNMSQIHRLIKRGVRIVFPDVNRLEALMLEELAQQKKPFSPSLTKPSTMQNRFKAAQDKAADRNNNHATSRNKTDIER